MTSIYKQSIYYLFEINKEVLLIKLAFDASNTPPLTKGLTIKPCAPASIAFVDHFICD